MKTLERRLGLTAVVSISIGAMLGSGLFVLPGLAASITGSGVWIAYIVAGICVLPAALSKAELATAMPTSGGSYVYLERTFGPLVGTIGGLGLWASLLLKSAFALVGMTWYLREVMAIPETATALIVLAAISLLNILGVKKVGQAQVVMVAASLLGLLAIVFKAAPMVDPEFLAAPLEKGPDSFVTAVAVVYISYAGVTKVAAIAEEVTNPSRNLPLGILFSLGTITLLYGGTTLLLTGILDPTLSHLDGGLQNDFHPIYSLADRIAGSDFAVGIAILGTLTMASMANAGLLAASRFPFAMSRDGLMPQALSSIHPTFMTPIACIILTASMMAVAIASLDLVSIAKLASSAMIIAYVGNIITVMVLREGRVRWYNPGFRSPWYPWTQIVGVIIGVVLLIMLGWAGLAAVAVMVIPGALLFFLYGRQQTSRVGVFGRMGPREKLIAEAEQRVEELRNALPGEADAVVALFGPERSPETLVEVGAALANGNKVEVLHLTHVPEQLNLDAMLEEEPQVASLRRRVEEVAQNRNLDIEFDAVVTRDVTETIHDTTSRVHCNWLVCAWDGHSHDGILHTTPIGWLADHLSCNMALFHDYGIRSLRKIAVLAEPGAHDQLVTETADHLASLYDAELKFIGFVPTDAHEMELQSVVDYLEQVESMTTHPENAQTQILRGKRKANAIIEHTQDVDLLVLASPDTMGIGDWFFGTDVDHIMRRSASSVLRLQTPRTSRTVKLAWRSTKEPRHPEIDLVGTMEHGCVEIQLPIRSKEELFRHIASRFASAHPELDYETLHTRMWDREKTQNTAVGDGVAVPHVTIAGSNHPGLGVFLTQEPIDYGAEDQQPVDIFFVTLNTESDREDHLEMLSRLDLLLESTTLCDRLRASNTEEDVRIAIRECEAML